MRDSWFNTERSLDLPETQALIDGLSTFATLADAVYRKDIQEHDRLKQGCAYVGESEHPDLRKDLPTGWIRLNNALIDRLQSGASLRQEPALTPCVSSIGLAYETYLLMDEQGKPTRAVIAFRGTENSDEQFKDDWLANFSGFDFGLADNEQFRTARLNVSRMITWLSDQLPPTERTTVCSASGMNAAKQAPIDLVGHSLGGGLAQHLAYSNASCNVRNTVTFDTSPVTGWFFLKERRTPDGSRSLIETPDPRIMRIHLDGEVLSWVRKVTTKFNLPRKNRTDYVLTFPGVRGGLVSRHSMTLFASCLQKWSSGSVGAKPGICNEN